MKAVIIAAGMGNRLWAKTDKIPKTLLPYKNGTVLSTIINNLTQAGIDEIIIVLGYNKTYIENYLKENRVTGNKISFMTNSEWERGNGLSVYLTRELTNDEPFMLSMSDHIVPVSAIKRVIESKKQTNLLLVDPKIDAIFDIDDATKVQLSGEKIINIGKEIRDYNYIDCGIFRLDSRFYQAMENTLKAGQESISAAVNQLVASDDMEGIPMQDDEFWIDIDTPEAYKYAIEQKDKLLAGCC
ncbi:MAG: NTP transferase domain-containing protein [Calditrichaceae bacterium]|nr:NTP transferase domain-containing protein [Calditrichaceae bacterium]MBN2710353.1 NTP transferase domain-containing protein [Calditrichaceae bacterium]RQV95102.1 MAG: hypothetical protein EH224_08430 [Calditrichota bacterium]